MQGHTATPNWSNLTGQSRWQGQAREVPQADTPTRSDRGEQVAHLHTCLASAIHATLPISNTMFTVFAEKIGM